MNEIKTIIDVMDAGDMPNKAFEILPGMTVEEMTALFFDEALIVAPCKLWQLNSRGHRYYYSLTEDGVPEFYPSVTTIISQTLPTSDFLIEWIANKGIEEAERYKMERAAYGTFMHAIYERLLIERSYDLGNLKTELANYITLQSLPGNFIHYADDLKKDLLAFAQFVLDYDVRPIAVEIALYHPDLKYAGMIDCPCTMRKRIGSDERITALIDFKSGRKGFYEDSEIQIHMYKMMWDANFPNLPIDRVFNFSPKDWRKMPTYNLKDQTNSTNASKILHMLELASIEDAKRSKTFVSVSGTISIEQGVSLEDNVNSLTLSELIRTKAPGVEMKGVAPVIIPAAKENSKTPKSVANKANKPKTENSRKITPRKKETVKSAPRMAKKTNLLNTEIEM